MAGRSDSWRSVLPQLSKKFRVIAPDLLDHGESAKPRSDHSLGAFAVWLRDFLDELDVSQATVVGHSLVAVPVDLRQDWPAALRRAGFDASAPKSSYSTAA